jgi:hypothetical protein
VKPDKDWIWILLAMIAVVLGLLVLATDAHAGWRRQTCRFSHGDGFSTEEVRRTIRCGTAHFTVAGGYPKALDVAMCESGLNEWAYSNGNYGVFQLRYWSSRRDAYNRAVGDRLDVKPPWWNARANVLVAVRYAHLYGWSAWSCA